jgi:multicomponent Na+:H+ antiporter subunit C
MSLALSIGFLAAAGVFLVLQRGMIRIILGFVLLTHAVNLLIIAAGGVARRDAPFADGDTSMAADPLPQAFVLTAIVIAFAITVVLATLAVVSKGDDDTEGKPPSQALVIEVDDIEASNSEFKNIEASKGGDLK